MTKRASGEDDYLDEDYEEEEQEVQPKKHILKKLEEEDEEEDLHPAVFSSFSGTRVCSQNFQAKSWSRTNSSSKVSPMRPKKSGTEKSGEMEVCVIKPRSMEDAREITETLLQDCTVVLNLEGLDIDLSQRVIDYLLRFLLCTVRRAIFSASAVIFSSSQR